MFVCMKERECVCVCVCVCVHACACVCKLASGLVNQQIAHYLST